jgi:hypothetical protein
MLLDHLNDVRAFEVRTPRVLGEAVYITRFDTKIGELAQLSTVENIRDFVDDRVVVGRYTEHSDQPHSRQRAHPSIGAIASLDAP